MYSMNLSVFDMYLITTMIIFKNLCVVYISSAKSLFSAFCPKDSLFLSLPLVQFYIHIKIQGKFAKLLKWLQIFQPIGTALMKTISSFIYMYHFERKSMNTYKQSFSSYLIIYSNVVLKKFEHWINSLQDIFVQYKQLQQN